MANHFRSIPKWTPSATGHDWWRNMATIAAFLLVLVSTSAGAAESVPKAVDTQQPYPEAVSLVHEADGWTYRETNTNDPLYFNAKDSPGHSICDSKCAEQWHPLLAQGNDKPIGEWTIFMRKDGNRQWAFKGRPVYTHAHDSPDKPVGDGQGGVWHLMPHFAR